MKDIESFFQFESVANIQEFIARIKLYLEFKKIATVNKAPGSDDYLICVHNRDLYTLSTEFSHSNAKVEIFETIGNSSDDEYKDLDKKVTIFFKRNDQRWKYIGMQIMNPTHDKFISGFINLVLDNKQKEEDFY